jgi:hypothetical protein
MKSNVEKLKKIGILGTVRKRLGADNEKDETYDESINEMDNSELIKQWCGWYLGDGNWWTTMKSDFDRLEEMDKEQ